MLKMSGEVLGVSLKLCWGNEMDEDVNHVCDIQTQQALREGVDSVDSCREVVWSHPGQLVLGAQCKLGPRSTLSVQGCSELRLPTSTLGLYFQSGRVKDTDEKMWLGVISS